MCTRQQQHQFSYTRRRILWIWFENVFEIVQMNVGVSIEDEYWNWNASSLFYSKYRQVLADIGLCHAPVDSEKLRLKLLGSKWNNKALLWPFIGICNRAENQCSIIDGCSHTTLVRTHSVRKVFHFQTKWKYVIFI